MSIKLLFTLKDDDFSAFLPLLQQGFRVSAMVGCNIQNLLCDQFGMMPAYLTDRINTIFLDSKPVDDVASAVVRDGATLALSASMPGLVGATFRKAGCLASFRGSITYQNEDDAPAVCHEGTVTLKLFNLLVSEMGPLFLKRGIWISGHELKEFINSLKSGIDVFDYRVEKEGHELNPKMLTKPEWISSDTRIFLQAI